MFRKNKVCAAVLIACGGTLGLNCTPLFAQQTLEKVEITGSSIKRVEAEGALPVTTLTREDIKKSGATTVTDLIQALPSMQNFVPASSSVNGSGTGITTAALHALPTKYTLVLLDGQRVAPLQLGNTQGGGFGVNLESIPLDAIERVEILTDGASAVYGSDAIAGVVNFITKKNRSDGDISLTTNIPSHAGGGSWNASISKGFGDLEADRFNILLAYSHDKQRKLQASQRDFSATGAYFPFASGGKNYIFNNRTGNTEPANLTFSVNPPAGSPPGTDPVAYSINPYYTANGNCGSSAAGALLDPTGNGALGAIGVSCRFNYAATVQNIPSSTRDSGLLKGTFKLGNDTTLWGELNLSRFTMTPQYAASAQPLVVSATKLPALFNAYVQPFLTANGLTLYVPPASLANPTPQGSATLGYRSVLVGGRADDYQTDARHIAFGVDGAVMGWDYKANVALSNTKLTDTAAGGYTDFDKFDALISSGAYDPVTGAGASTLSSAVLNTVFKKDTSNLNTLHFGAQHDLVEMPGGTSILALGADYSFTHYRVDYGSLYLANSGFSTQPASSDFPIGGNYGQVPFDASRTNWSLFGEMLLPVVKSVEVTTSLRYDTYSKTHSKYVFDTAVDPVSGLQNQLADADLGNTFKATTGKVSLRYSPVEQLLLRGSYGTGFKAPNISDIAGARTFGGSTSNSYGCPFPGSPGCLPGSAQYDLLIGPNGLSGVDGLKPEKSKQWTLGFRVDPSKSLSIGLDLWDVKIKNQVLSQGVAEQVAFANPGQYSGLFVNPYQDPAGFTTIAFIQRPFNGGQAEYQGIDWDFSYRTRLDIGNLAARWTGTQMLKQQYNFGPGQPFNTDLGVYGPDQQVVFRTTMNFSLSLDTGDFTNTVTARYKSGYRDISYTADNAVVFNVNPDGSLGDPVDFAGLRVPSYTTFDWQCKYDYTKAFQLTLGIKNLFDRDPPRSLQTGGGGNQVGYDGRYTDPIGRQFYLSAQYRF